jgi:hypothetical protein
MSNAVPAQHPAVVLRSSYQHLRALLAIATIAIVGLTVAVVVLATNDGRDATSSATRVVPMTISTSASAEPGARLDHRGLKERLSAGPDYHGHY